MVAGEMLALPATQTTGAKLQQPPATDGRCGAHITTPGLVPTLGEFHEEFNSITIVHDGPTCDDFTGL